MAVPIIDTPRLQLRGHEVADLDACAAMWADPEIVRYIGNRPSSREETWARLLRYRGHWELLGFGFWAVVERATGTFVGELGLADFRREVASWDPRPASSAAEGWCGSIAPPLGAEAGWVIARAAHGQGYATEGLRAALAWGAAHVAAREVSAVIEPDNAASLRVAHKCGFTGVASATYHGAELIVLRALL